MTDTKQFAEKIIKILDDKKALNIKLLKIDKQTVIADYFIIATGTSSTHIRSLADEVEFKLKEEDGITPTHIDGVKNQTWVVMDYDNVIVHIFNGESRDYYKLEKLWYDGGEVDHSAIIKGFMEDSEDEI